MSMPDCLERLVLSQLRQEHIFDVIKNYKGIAGNKPSSFAYDPRNGFITVFSPKRSHRPKDVQKQDEGIAKPCPICSGNTTPILAVKELSNGAYAFVNENLYPFLHPEGIENINPSNKDRLVGGHFLIWPTSEHKDIHQISYEDHAKTLEFISEFEANLSKGFYMQVIKNTGKLVGNSLEHGHYQVAIMNMPAGRIMQDMAFLASRGHSFVEFLANNTPGNLEVGDYGSVKAVIPYFMRRPLEIIIHPKDFKKEKLEPEIARDFARAISDTAFSLSLLMPTMGREFAYNIEFHNGPIGTCYAEILPYTQEDGGYERIGLYVCQSLPKISAKVYRDFRKNGFLKKWEKAGFNMPCTSELKQEVYDKCFS